MGSDFGLMLERVSMEISSFITSIAKGIKSIFPWVLKKFGYKLVKDDVYEEEICEITEECLKIYPHCIQEIKNGSEFFWSDQFRYGKKKYWEIHQNKKV